MALLLWQGAHRWLSDRNSEAAGRLAVAREAAQEALRRETRAQAARDSLAREIGRLRGAQRAVRARTDTVLVAVEAAPDTCAPFIRALSDRIEAERAVADSVIETQAVRIAADSVSLTDLRDRLRALTEVSVPKGRSFLSRLVPSATVGIGPFAGIDYTGKPTAGLGVGVVLHW